MKSFKFITGIVAIALVCASGIASADLKIGLVDKQTLGNDSLYAKNVNERMRKEFSARNDALVAKQMELKAKYEGLERDKDILSTAERAKKEKEIAKLEQTLKSEGESFQSELMQRQETERASFEKIVSEVLNNLAKEEKLDMILEQQVALYSGAQSDYTNKALQALDKRYKEAKR